MPRSGGHGGSEGLVGDKNGGDDDFGGGFGGGGGGFGGGDYGEDFGDAPDGFGAGGGWGAGGVEPEVCLALATSPAADTPIAQ